MLVKRDARLTRIFVNVPAVIYERGRASERKTKANPLKQPANDVSSSVSAWTSLLSLPYPLFTAWASNDCWSHSVSLVLQVRLTDEALGLTDGVGDKESEPGAAIEMTTLPLAAAMIVGEDTCPQCSSASAKTSFMTFDELADVGAINNRAAANPSSVIGPVNPSV